ncbi:MAG: DUF2937 family protein [Aliishimia sp.]
MIRILALMAGLAGAAGFSQFPEFSQQYVQRLGGAVGALGEVVADFDTSAQAEGLSRADALAQMVGSDFVARRRADMERTLDRYDRLNAQLSEVQTAGPFMRAYYAGTVDGEIARAAWDSYQPAVPLNFAGGVFGSAGFLTGWACVVAIFGGLGRLLRRRHRSSIGKVERS